MTPIEPPATLRRLGAADAPAWRALMLDALAREPDAFTSDAAESAALPLDWWVLRVLQLQASAHNEAALRLYAARGFVVFGSEPLAVRHGDDFVTKLHLWRALP